MELFQVVVKAASERSVKGIFAAKDVSDYGGGIKQPKTDGGHPLAAAAAVDIADWLLESTRRE